MTVDAINLPLTPGQMLDLSAGRVVQVVVTDVPVRQCRVRIEGQWRDVHPADIEVVYDSRAGDEQLSIVVFVRPPRESTVYTGPCHDPQCSDSTWDHDCPLPPGDWIVTNGITHKRGSRG